MLVIDLWITKGGIFRGPCAEFWHVIRIVGYGISNDGEKFWIINNSWGEGWGEAGYTRLGLRGISKYDVYPSL